METVKQEEEKTFYTFRFSVAKAAIHRPRDRYLGLQYKIDFKNSDMQSKQNAQDIHELLRLFKLKSIVDAACIYAERARDYEQGKIPCLEMILPLTLDEMGAGLDLIEAETMPILDSITKYAFAKINFTTKAMQKEDAIMLMQEIGINKSKGRRGLPHSENYKIMEGGTWQKKFYATGEKIDTLQDVLEKELLFYENREQFTELQLECTGKKQILYSREKELGLGYSECQGRDIFTKEEFEKIQEWNPT